MGCKICSLNRSLFGAAALLSKYKVQYFRRYSGGMIQTEDPYWLGEAITKSDVGLLSRNITFAHRSTALLYIFFDKKDKVSGLRRGTVYLCV